DGITKCQQAVREVKVSSDVNDYILKLVRATREHPALLLGASPRASLGLFRAAQALTAIQGKDAVTMETVKALAQNVLAHRLIVRRDDKHRNTKVAQVVEEIVSRTSD